jgi:hypothetical protein
MMNKSRKMRWTGNVARMEAMRNAYIVVVENPERKRPLGRPKRKRKQCEMMRTEFIWLSINTSGRFL